MRISYFNPTENFKEWETWHVDKTVTELEARQIFASFIGPGKSLNILPEEQDGESPSLYLEQYWEDEWEVTLHRVIHNNLRMGTVTRKQAERLIEAIFRQENLISATNSLRVNWTDIPKAHHRDSLFHHPGISRIEDDGKIVMQAGGSGESGIWDGFISFEPSTADYQFWHWLVTSKKWSSCDKSVGNDLISRLKKEFEQSRNQSQGKSA
ncbi:MAG TPA: hypothetical protein VGH19_03005 [Verrucomicrobiae bacterium]